MNQEQVHKFVEALENDFICLHPTDTLPGLSFHPKSQRAKSRLYSLKQREANKPMISLVSSLEQAKEYWGELPEFWEQNIEKLWPEKLTIVWQASKKAPKSLVNEAGLIALRYPKLDKSEYWLYQAIETMGYPLPSSSVNRAGEPSKKTWKEASHFSSQSEYIYVPEEGSLTEFSNNSSTIILLEKDSFKTLREGAFETSEIKSVLRKSDP